MRKPSGIVFLIMLFILIILVSSFQFFWYITTTPQGFLFPFIHNSPGDYYYYLSFIRQGMEGNFLAISRYTSELYPGKPVFLFFTTIGFFGGLFHLDAASLYTISRFVLSFLFLGTLWVLITRLFSGKERWGAFLFIFCTTPVWYRTPTLLRQVGDFWSGIDPLMRLVFLPHHTLAHIAFILSLIALVGAVKQRSIGMGIVASILAFLSWTSNAALFPVFVGIVGLFFLSHLKLFGDSAIRSIGVVIALFVCIELVLYGSSFSSVSFPWGYVAQWERTQQYPLDVFQFFLMLGPMSILALYGVAVAWKKSFLWQCILLWFLVPFFLLLFQRFLPFSNVRFVQAAPYVPTGLLGLLAGVHIMKSLGLHRMPWLGSLAFAGIILYAIPSYVASVQNQRFCYEGNVRDPLFYVSKDGMDMVSYLDAVGLPDEVVLAPDPLPTLIPAFSNKRVVYAYPLYTFNFTEKQKMGYEFFGGNHDLAHTDFLVRERVTFVVFEKYSAASLSYLNTNQCSILYQNSTYVLCRRHDAVLPVEK